MTALFWDVRTFSGYTLTTREPAAAGGKGQRHLPSGFLNVNRASSPSYGRHLTLSWGLPTYPGAHLKDGEGTQRKREGNEGVVGGWWGSGVVGGGSRTVRSTGRCSRAGTPCTGSRRFQGSRRSGRTWRDNERTSDGTGGATGRPGGKGRGSLVVGVGVGAGAGLAVLWGTDRGLAEEAGSALLAQLTLGVMEAALTGARQHFSQEGGNSLPRKAPRYARTPYAGLPTVQIPVSGWQESECPLHSHSSQWPRYKPPPVRVYPAAQSLKKDR